MACAVVRPGVNADSVLPANNGKLLGFSLEVTVNTTEHTTMWLNFLTYVKIYLHRTNGCVCIGLLMNKHHNKL